MKSGSLGTSFRWFNVTQFLGALNDNVFKLLLINFLIAITVGSSAGGIAGIAGLMFAVPFLLFTPVAGELADRFSKRDIVVWAKALEIVVMLAGTLAFMAGHAMGLYAVLFLMAAQSAFFGPSKYGIIPELVPRDDLSRANGQLVMMTYLAIILGTVLGPQLAHWLQGRYTLANLACVLIAVAGTLTSLGIKRTAAGGRKVRGSLLFWRSSTRILREFRHDRQLIVAIYGYSYFSVVGAFLQAAVIQFGMERLGYTSVQATALFLYAALGIAAGAWLAGRLSGRHIEFGLVPLGALLIAGSTAWLALGAYSLTYVAIGLLAAGVGSGLYVVPLEAFLQWRSPPDRRGEVVATGGFLSWVGIFLGSLLCTLLLGALKWSAAQGILLLCALTLTLGAISLKALPDFFIRFIALLLARAPQRVQTVGMEHVPGEGGALLVANHGSILDALFLVVAQQRRIRFLMHRGQYERSRLRPLLKLMDVQCIALEDSSKDVDATIDATRRILDDGHLVCIFAEGSGGRTGLLRGPRPHMERILRGSGHPVLPVYIGGTWGRRDSISYSSDVLRPPRRFRQPVAVLVGPPLPPDAGAPEVAQAIRELSCDYFETLKSDHRSLGAIFIRQARRNWSAAAIDDTSGRSLTWGHALAGAVALSRILRAHTAGQECVGILLPPSVGGALVNLALTLLRKVTVNLNFTASAEALNSAIRQTDLRTIITSRAFLEKFPAFAGLPGLVMAEDLRAAISGPARVSALFAARLAPLRCLTPMRVALAEDAVTILFSSGTTGEPKGIILSHHNIASNVKAFHMVLQPSHQDRLCATLPLFHSFGFTCGVWFPALTGIKASYHVSPLDAARVAEMVRTRGCTALLATPTFLMAYLRKASRADFASLRIVVAGAEKLKPQLADAFEAHFGLRPVEGYGATELSPVAACSVVETEIDGIYQIGHKEGSVGQTIPGVAARVVDPETGAPLAVGQNGLLLIKGPNVMRGYLHHPEATRDAVLDGWYRTGDMARLDDEGFITITDRLARFSKIGGEMIPHLAIEDVYQRGLNTTEAVLAVTAVTCDRRGERLVVLFTAAAGDPRHLHDLLDGSGLPNLWKPDRSSYYPIEALPLTGSGKLDVKTLRCWAAELVRGASEL